MNSRRAYLRSFLFVTKGGDLLYDENQFVRIKWNTTNREWFELKGYVFTKRYDEFDVRAKDLMPNSSAVINVICDYCGRAYKTQYASITSGRKIINKDCCSKCTGLKTSEVSYRKRANKAIKNLQDVCKMRGYELLTTVDDYKGIREHIKFVCPRHGEMSMIADNLIHGHECIKCSYEKRGIGLRFTPEYIKSEIDICNENTLLNPYDYKDIYTRNLNIRCKCGNVFTTSFGNYIKAGVNRCPFCTSKESSGEKIIRVFLEDNDIGYEREKRFVDCRDTKPLPFDFYIPEQNTVIEFDGQHHYKNIDGYGDYEATCRHDKIKNDYCKNNNIKLIRIPYWDGHNINEILTKELL